MKHIIYHNTAVQKQQIKVALFFKMATSDVKTKISNEDVTASRQVPGKLAKVNDKSHIQS